jgi:hypothetical protein
MQFGLLEGSTLGAQGSFLVFTVEMLLVFRATPWSTDVFSAFWLHLSQHPYLALESQNLMAVLAQSWHSLLYPRLKLLTLKLESGLMYGVLMLAEH